MEWDELFGTRPQLWERPGEKEEIMKKGISLLTLSLLCTGLLGFVLGCEPKPCLEEAVLGEYVDTVAGLELYEGCDEDGYLLVHPGRLPVDTAGEISELRDRHPGLISIPGVVGHGTGLCCLGGSDDICVSMMLASHILTPEQLARTLALMFAEEWINCFGIRVDVIGYLVPRCEESPDCLPLPMCPEATGPGCCPVAPVYDPEAPRTVAIEAGSPMSGLELPEGDDECTHDGECVQNGCGQYCTAYTAPGFISTCECYPALHDTFCGCVEGRCRWFRQ